MNRLFAWAGLALAAPLAATPAAAATYTITYTGTVTEGYDHTRVLGDAIVLTGQAFTAVYTLTDPLPGAYSYNSDTYGYTYGGSAYGTPSPLSAMITIADRGSYAIDGEYAGYLRQIDTSPNSSAYDEVYHSVQNYSLSPTAAKDERLYIFINSYVNDFVSSGDYTAPLAYTIDPAEDYQYGYFRAYGYGYDPDAGQTTYFNFAEAHLTVATVSIARVGGVPEPDAWALLILGFGATGAAMRGARRRRGSAAHA